MLMLAVDLASYDYAVTDTVGNLRRAWLFDVHADRLIGLAGDLHDELPIRVFEVDGFTKVKSAEGVVDDVRARQGLIELAVSGPDVERDRVRPTCGCGVFVDADDDAYRVDLFAAGN